jgi:hypothetical protein
MFHTSIRVAFLGSAAAIAFTAAHAQEQQPANEANANPEACVILANRLAEDTAVDQEVRGQVEQVIATGDPNQCQALFANWDQEGSVSQQSVEMVTSESATQRMIVQQEVEVAAEAFVYQPPPEVTVDTGTPEVLWTMPQQSLTIEERAPEITVRQGQPVISVEIPQPRITVMIPEPEIIVTWPDATASMTGEMEPVIEVRIPEPVVTVNMPEPIVELSIGGATPQDLVQLDDGRFAPQGSTQEDLQPRITLQRQDVTINPTQEAQAPEVVFNRSQPIVNVEAQQPQVSVELVGEPEVNVTAGGQTGQQQQDAAGTEGAAQPPQTEGDAQQLPAADDATVLPEAGEGATLPQTDGTAEQQTGDGATQPQTDAATQPQTGDDATLSQTDELADPQTDEGTVTGEVPETGDDGATLPEDGTVEDEATQPSGN